MTDDEFSRLFMDAYNRAPLWKRDQFDASLRNFVEALQRLDAWVKAHPDEYARLQTEEADQ